MKQRFVFWCSIGFIGLYLSALVNVNAFDAENRSSLDAHQEIGLAKNTNLLAIDLIKDVTSNGVYSVKGKSNTFVDNFDFFVKDQHSLQILFSAMESRLQFEDASTGLFQHLSKILYPFHSFW